MWFNWRKKKRLSSTSTLLHCLKVISSLPSPQGLINYSIFNAPITLKNLPSRSFDMLYYNFLFTYWSQLQIIPLDQSQIILILLSLCVHVKSFQSCLTLLDPMDCSPPGSSVHGILQARILERAAMPSKAPGSQRDSWMWLNDYVFKDFLISTFFDKNSAFPSQPFRPLLIAGGLHAYRSYSSSLFWFFDGWLIQFKRNLGSLLIRFLQCWWLYLQLAGTGLGVTDCDLGITGAVGKACHLILREPQPPASQHLARCTSPGPLSGRIWHLPQGPVSQDADLRWGSSILLLTWRFPTVQRTISGPWKGKKQPSGSAS